MPLPAPGREWEDGMTDGYLWIKAAHVISVISWMAGLLYLPRLFVYHADAAPGSEASEMFKVMERRLLRFIMNPAMIGAYVFGTWMLVLSGYWTAHWMWVKIVMILLLTLYHHALALWYKAFARDANRRSARFYRLVNEVPAVIMIIIVILVVVKPF